MHSAVDEADDCTGIVINGGSDTASFVELASKVSSAPSGCRTLHVGPLPWSAVCASVEWGEISSPSSCMIAVQASRASRATLPHVPGAVMPAS